jgi:hypothetical protein
MGKDRAHRPILSAHPAAHAVAARPDRALATPSRFCDDPALGWWIKGLVAMGLNRCLFGCLLALSSVGTAAAMGVTTQDPTAPRTTLESTSHDGGSSTASDAASANHDCTPSDPAMDSTDASEGGGGGSTPHPRASHHGSLGWQSLLPGSIQ